MAYDKFIPEDRDVENPDVDFDIESTPTDDLHGRKIEPAKGEVMEEIIDKDPTGDYSVSEGAFESFLAGTSAQSGLTVHSHKGSIPCVNMSVLIAETTFTAKDGFHYKPTPNIVMSNLKSLNKFSYPGTNLYEGNVDDYILSEHSEPWKSKTEFVLLKTLEARFNRLIFFDGLNVPHGMGVSSDLFCDEIRLSQVMFFEGRGLSHRGKEGYGY